MVKLKDFIVPFLKETPVRIRLAKKTDFRVVSKYGVKMNDGYVFYYVYEGPLVNLYTLNDNMKAMLGTMYNYNTLFDTVKELYVSHSYISDGILVIDIFEPEKGEAQ